MVIDDDAGREIDAPIIVGGRAPSDVQKHKSVVVKTAIGVALGIGLAYCAYLAVDALAQAYARDVAMTQCQAVANDIAPGVKSKIAPADKTRLAVLMCMGWPQAEREAVYQTIRAQRRAN